MLFPTFTFAAFFVVVLTVGWIIPHKSVWWKIFMLGASYYFYANWDARFLGLIAGSTIVNQAAAAAIWRLRQYRWKKAVLYTALALNLATLGFFKYAGFFVESAQSLLRSLGVESGFTLLNIILPVGISFFTFQAISYVVDVHRGRTPPVGLLDFAVYLSFFPQLVAGPIVRATEFMPELAAARRPDRAETGRAVQLIGRGLFKKVVISDFLARAIVDDAFGAPSEYGALDVLFGIYGYAVQIYADFSGYTDMAIGIALLLGFRFPQNFDRPYAATSVQDFWRRWHMTLSRWLRDYLYIPLGGSRRGKLATYRNLLATMALGGLWHGAAGVFVMWGLYHGAGLAVERLVDDGRVRRGWRVPSVRSGGLSWLLTFHFVCGGWVLFNSDTLDRAWELLGRLLNGWGTGPELVNPLVLAAIVGSILAQQVSAERARKWSAATASAPLAATAVGFAAWIMVVVALGPEGVSDFIYFQF